MAMQYELKAHPRLGKANSEFMGYTLWLNQDSGRNGIPATGATLADALRAMADQVENLQMGLGE